MENSSISPVQRLWRLLKPDRKEIRNVYVYALFNGLVNLSLPLGIQAIINLIQGGRVSFAWAVLVAVVVGGVLVTGILQIAQLRIIENLQQRIFARSAFEFAYRIPRIKLESVYGHYFPELVNRFFDTVTVQKGLSKLLVEFSLALLQVVFGMILLSLYHPFFIFFNFIIILLAFAIFRLTGKPGLDTSLVESRYKYRVAHWLEELARAGTTFKLAGRTELPLERTDNEVHNYLEARESHFKVLVQQYSLMVLFKVAVAAGLLIMGGILVMNQNMNIGQFVAAEIIILLVMNSVEKLVVTTETVYDVLTALEKIGQVTDLPLQNMEEKGLSFSDETSVHLQLKDVHFSFPGAKKEVLRGVNLELRRGETVLLTGPNGSGKSTLLQVVAGLYELRSGQILYNEIPCKNIGIDSLRLEIGSCLIQQQLFEGTLLENITVGRENVELENVKWAVKNLGLQSFVDQLPDGYHTVIHQEGEHLSASTLLKLKLARSIVHKPKLLLLEYALEHLEEKDGKAVVDFLLDKANGWTILAASYNPYFLSKADRVVFMQNGIIVGPER